MSRIRIALVHAVTVAVDPVQHAFKEGWPEAELVNILDDALSPDRARDADLTPAMSERIMMLGSYALSTEADGILYTCSAFGPAIEAFARTASVPVLKPNEAMFRRALASGSRIGMLATFGPSVASMEEEFRQMAASRKGGASIETILVADAMAALKQGDVAAHNARLADAAGRLSACDAIMLAHFSTARAYASVAASTRRPVLTSPGAAVEELQRRCRAGVAHNQAELP